MQCDPRKETVMGANIEQLYPRRRTAHESFQLGCLLRVGLKDLEEFARLRMATYAESGPNSHGRGRPHLELNTIPDVPRRPGGASRPIARPTRRAALQDSTRVHGHIPAGTELASS